MNNLLDTEDLLTSTTSKQSTKRSRQTDSGRHTGTKKRSLIQPTQSNKKSKSIKKSKRIFAPHIITRRNTQQTADILQEVCHRLGTDLCLSLSTYRQDILTLFENFIYFNNVHGNTYRLGKPSANGFIRKLEYKIRNITSHAILKSSANTISDNLAYEYAVGLFVNKYRTIFSCFVQTYGLYYYISKRAWTFSKDHINIDADRLRQNLELQQHLPDYSDICKYSKYAAILIEDIASKETLGDYLKFQDEGLEHFAKFKLVYILYQIYFPLSVLSDQFTHYDLHSDNILLYEPFPGKYIEYHYHCEDGSEVVFKSTFIAKIIDYGRSFYHIDDGDNSKTFYDNLCATDECSTTDTKVVTSKKPDGKLFREKINIKIPCGEDFGFDTMSDYAETNWQIRSYKKNASHDLRLLYSFIKPAILRLSSEKTKELSEFREMLRKITYGKGVTMFNESVGTIENNSQNGRINNVKQAEQEMRHILRKGTILQELNDGKYHNIENKLGDLHMYIDGTPMHFDIYQHP